MTRPIPLLVVVVLALAAAAPAALAQDGAPPPASSTTLAPTAAHSEAGTPSKSRIAHSEAGTPSKSPAAPSEAGTPRKSPTAPSEAGTPSKPTKVAVAVPAENAAALASDESGDEPDDVGEDALPSADTAAAETKPPPMELTDEQMKTLPPPSIGAGELLGPLFKTMVMLLVVLGIVYLTLHKGLGKLMERQNLGKRMKVVERVALDTKRTLYLVDIDGKQMVLAAGEGGVVVIKHMDATHPEKRDFAEVLKPKTSNDTHSADASAARTTGA